MKSKVFEFESTAFTVLPAEAEETNPGIFGKALSFWLAEQLMSQGYQTAAVIPEDFGWCIPIISKGHRLYAVCASVDHDPARWRVFGFAEGGVLRRLLGRDIRAQAVDRLHGVLETIFRDDPRIKNLRQTTV